jgi:hypothetical protein
MKQKNRYNRTVNSPDNFNLIGFSFELVSAFIILVFSILSSCGKETLSIPSPSFNYFPTTKGTYVIYNVDSIVHGTNDNNNDDSVYFFHYQMKEIIDSSFTDGEGAERQILLRYYRKDSTEDWTFSSVWTQSLSSTNAYRWEENIAYHKLSFPINSDIEWNGNDKNTFNEVLFQYEDIHSSRTINNLSFDSTIVVTDNAEPNAVEDISNNEIYAAGVGMIYKKNVNLRKSGGQVISGTQLTMEVASYGK